MPTLNQTCQVLPEHGSYFYTTPYAPIRLTEGDQIEVGDTVLVFEIES